MALPAMTTIIIGMQAAAHYPDRALLLLLSLSGSRGRGDIEILHIISSCISSPAGDGCKELIPHFVVHISFLLFLFLFLQAAKNR